MLTPYEDYHPLHYFKYASYALKCMDEVNDQYHASENVAFYCKYSHYKKKLEQQFLALQKIMA